MENNIFFKDENLEFIHKHNQHLGKFLAKLGVLPTQILLKGLKEAILADKEDYMQAERVRIAAGIKVLTKLQQKRKAEEAAKQQTKVIKMLGKVRETAIELIANDAMYMSVDYMPEMPLNKYLTRAEINKLDELTQSFSDVVQDQLDTWFIKFLEGEFNIEKENLDQINKELWAF